VGAGVWRRRSRSARGAGSVQRQLRAARAELAIINSRAAGDGGEAQTSGRSTTRSATRCARCSRVIRGHPHLRSATGIDAYPYTITTNERHIDSPPTLGDRASARMSCAPARRRHQRRHGRGKRDYGSSCWRRVGTQVASMCR
jgi:hypothetical protein